MHSIKREARRIAWDYGYGDEEQHNYNPFARRSSRSRVNLGTTMVVKKESCTHPVYKPDQEPAIVKQHVPPPSTCWPTPSQLALSVKSSEPQLSSPRVLDTGVRYVYPPDDALFDSWPISHDQLAAEVKDIYSSLPVVEAKCIKHDQAEQTTRSKSHLKHEQWQQMIALHRTLLYEHHDFLSASQHPTASIELRSLAQESSMPARMWKHGIHSFIEVLRRRSPFPIHPMIPFICGAYQELILLHETVSNLSKIRVDLLAEESQTFKGLSPSLLPQPVRQEPIMRNEKFICITCTTARSFERKCEWSKHMDKHDRPYRGLESKCMQLQRFTCPIGQAFGIQDTHTHYFEHNAGVTSWTEHRPRVLVPLVKLAAAFVIGFLLSIFCSPAFWVWLVASAALVRANDISEKLRRGVRITFSNLNPRALLAVGMVYFVPVALASPAYGMSSAPGAVSGAGHQGMYTAAFVASAWIFAGALKDVATQVTTYSAKCYTKANDASASLYGALCALALSIKHFLGSLLDPTTFLACAFLVIAFSGSDVPLWVLLVMFLVWFALTWAMYRVKSRRYTSIQQPIFASAVLIATGSLICVAALVLPRQLLTCIPLCISLAIWIVPVLSQLLPAQPSAQHTRAIEDV